MDVVDEAAMVRRDDGRSYQQRLRMDSSERLGVQRGRERGDGVTEQLGSLFGTDDADPLHVTLEDEPVCCRDATLLGVGDVLAGKDELCAETLADLRGDERALPGREAAEEGEVTAL